MLKTLFRSKAESVDLEMYGTAVERGQALFECALDGTIITANGKFLSLMGYGLDELDEIVGKPHRSLCEPAHADSPAYQAAWEAVRRGEAAQQLAKWLGKEGKEVWVAVIYVPLGERGLPSKVVALATDVTALKTELETVKEELSVRQAILDVTSIVSEANLKGDIVWANDKYVQVSKYSREELIGRGHNITRHPDMPKEVFKQMWATIGRGQIFRGVVKNRARTARPITWTRSLRRSSIRRLASPGSIWASGMTSRNRRSRGTT